MMNDDNPFSNLGDYENRKTDDHGLTLMAGFYTQFDFNFNKKIRTRIFTKHSTALYTKGFGTLSIIKPENPDYEYFKYILAKHPDWDNILLYNQIAITKNTNSLNFLNSYFNILFGAGIEFNEIGMDDKQLGAAIQQTFHKTLKVRNYYHKPFTDSSSFKNSFNYTSFLFHGGTYFNKEYSRFNLYTELFGSIKYNSVSHSIIKKIMPSINWNSTINFGKKISYALRRFELNNILFYNPNEILQYASDPGTKGYNVCKINIVFTGKPLNKINNWVMIYKINPFEIAMPFGRKDDLVFNYQPVNGKLNLLTGYMNVSAGVLFK